MIKRWKLLNIVIQTGEAPGGEVLWLLPTSWVILRAVSVGVCVGGGWRRVGSNQKKRIFWNNLSNVTPTASVRGGDNAIWEISGSLQVVYSLLPLSHLLFLGRQSCKILAGIMRLQRAECDPWEKVKEGRSQLNIRRIFLGFPWWSSG